MSLSRAAHRTFSPGAALTFLPSIVRETFLTFASTLPLILSPRERKSQRRSYLPKLAYHTLKEPLYLAGLRINIYPSEGRIGAGARHKADCPGAGAEELRPGINQHIANGQSPSLGDALKGRVVCQAQVGLYHHGGVSAIFSVTLKHFGLGLGIGSP